MLKRVRFRWLLLICMVVMLLLTPSATALITYHDMTSKFTPYELTGNGVTDIVEVAKRQKGKTGKSLGCASGDEWCAVFVLNCAAYAQQSAAVPAYAKNCVELPVGIVNHGKGITIYDKANRTGIGKNYGNISNAKSGDLLTVDWENDGKADHIEIITSVNKDTGVITSIGGNRGSSDGTLSKVDTTKWDTADEKENIVLIVRPNYTDKTIFEEAEFVSGTWLNLTVNSPWSASNYSGLLSMPGVNSTYPDVKTECTLSGGETLTAFAIYKNGPGHYWYRVRYTAADGKAYTGFIYYNAVTVNGIADNCTALSGNEKLGQLTKGKTHSLSGYVVTTANGVKLDSVTGTITDSLGTKRSHTDDTASGTSYTLNSTKENSVDHNLSFGSMASGECKYTIRAKVTAPYIVDSTTIDKTSLNRTFTVHTETFYEMGPYKVKYDANGGSAPASASTSVEFNGSVKLPDYTGNKEEYAFRGWSVQLGSHGKILAADNTWVSREEIESGKAEPQWFPAGSSFTVNGSRVNNETNTDIIFVAVWATPQIVYLDKCTTYESSAILTVKDTANLMDCPSSNSVKSGATILAVFDSGTVLTETKLYKNIEGEYWYKTSHNGTAGYVYASDVVTEANWGEVSYTNTSGPSGTRNCGASLSLKGTAKSNLLTMNKIGVYVYPGTAVQSSAHEIGSEISISKKSYSIDGTSLDANCKMGTLPAGSHTYVVKVKLINNISIDGKTMTSPGKWFFPYHKGFTVVHTWNSSGNCSSCGASKSCSHSWSTGTQTKAPTCTAEGEITQKCTKSSRCAIKITKVAALGHDYTWSITKEPTENASGVLTKGCSRCTITEEFEIPSLSKTLYLPAELQTIETEAFSGIAAEMIVIPQGVQTIEANAFSGCTNLKLLYFLTDSVTMSAVGISSDVAVLCAKGGSIEQWANAEGFRVLYQ